MLELLAYYNKARDAKFSDITHVKTKSKRLAHSQFVFAYKIYTETIITWMLIAKFHNERECYFSNAQYILSCISLAFSRWSQRFVLRKRKKKSQKQIYSRTSVTSNTWQMAHRPPVIYFYTIFIKGQSLILSLTDSALASTYHTKFTICTHDLSWYFVEFTR